MGMIKIEIHGSFDPHRKEMFSAIQQGHAQATVDAILWLVQSVLPRAITQDERLQDTGHFPEAGFPTFVPSPESILRAIFDKESPGRTAIEITDDPTSLSSILQECIDQLHGPDGKASSREKALAVTKLQEARFWVTEDMFRNNDAMTSGQGADDDLPDSWRVR